METIQQIMKSAGLDQIPPDILMGAGLVLGGFILWRLAMIKVKMLVGLAVGVAVALAAWHGYLWMQS